MSAGVPYVAPWQTGWERFATQLLVPAAVGSSIRRVTVPEGQWWRLIYISTSINTSAVVANRSVAYEVFPPAGTGGFIMPAALMQTASTTIVYTFSPHVSSYALAPASLPGVAVAAVPDLLWAPGTLIQLEVQGIQAGDTYAGQLGAAVEVYIVERPGRLVPLPAPLVL